MMTNSKVEQSKITLRFMIELSLSLFILFFMLFVLKEMSIRNSIRLNNKQIRVEMVLKTLNDNQFEIFYDIGNLWNIKDAVSQKVHGSNNFQNIVFIIPSDTIIKGLRFDIDTVPGIVQIKSIKLKCFNNEYEWEARNIAKDFIPLNQFGSFYLSNNVLHIKAKGVVQQFITKADISSITKNMLFSFNKRIITFIIALFLAIFFFSGIHFIPFSSFKFIRNNYSNYLPAYTLKNFFFTIIFILLIFLPLMSKIIKIDPMAINKEKRLLAAKPHLRFAALLYYPRDYSAYFDDNFGFRNLLVFCNSYFKLKYFHTSALPNKVVLGKEDWLFFSMPGVLEICRHTTLFTDKELLKIKNNIEKRAAWVKLKGGHYYIMMPPDKNTVYPEYTPPLMKPKYSMSRMDQLEEYMEKNSSVHIIDLRNIFKKTKKKRVLYYKTDTHWNIYGGFLAYTELIKVIKADFPSIQPYKLDDFNIQYVQLHGGDLAQMLELNDLLVKEEIILVPKRNYTSIGVPTPNYHTSEIFYNPFVVREKPDSKLPVMVMFMDSYANLFIQFISENFRRSAYDWSPKFNTDIIEYEKPDVVVHEILERHIEDLLFENPEVVDRDLEAYAQHNCKR